MDDRLPGKPGVILYVGNARYIQLTGGNEINTHIGSSAASQGEFIG